MQKTQTLTLYPNPYLTIDHRGMLAGACPEPEERPAGSFPTRRHIGAKTVFLGEEIRDKAGGGAPGTPVPNKHHYAWKFDSEPTTVTVPNAAFRAFYETRLRGPDHEIFVADADGDPPIAKLAAARLDAIEKFVANYGVEPPHEKWVDQFELDEIVAQAMKPLAEARNAAKKEADQAAKDAAVEREAAAKSALEARKERWAKSLAKALAPAPDETSPGPRGDASPNAPTDPPPVANDEPSPNLDTKDEE